MNTLKLSHIPTPALERWLAQYEGFVAQTKAELAKRIANEEWPVETRGQLISEMKAEDLLTLRKQLQEDLGHVRTRTELDVHTMEIELIDAELEARGQ
jgi:hypothetical protein